MYDQRVSFLWLIFVVYLRLIHDIICPQRPECVLQLSFARAYDRTACAFAHLVSVWQIPGIYTAYHGVPYPVPLPPALLPTHTPAVLSALPAHRQPPAPTDTPACPGSLTQPRAMEHQRTRARVHHGQRRRWQPVRAQRHRRLRGVLRAGDGVLVLVDVGACYATNGVRACGAL